ncbi:hypothetical protein BGZ94_008348 [Podila epigama]|nr:hypothetical protein BGZ94_008348 [Podila epigama]
MQVAEAQSFEAERSRLVNEIAIEMNQAITNINILKRNLETIVTIGQEFDQLSQLWSHLRTNSLEKDYIDETESHPQNQ